MSRPIGYLLLAALVASGCAPLPYALNSSHDTLMGIDVALESDVASAGRSHITMVRRFVRSSEIHDICATLGTIMASTNLDNLQMKATGSHAQSANGSNATTALSFDPSADLRRLEERIAEALHMFAENPVDAKEYIVTPDGSRMSEATIDAIYDFVPNQSGVNFHPQLPVTSAQAGADAVVLKAIGLSVYQIGRSGTADRALWTWNGEPGAR